MAAVGDLAARQRLGELVEQITTSGNLTLDETLTGEFKKLCKKSDVNVKFAFDLLEQQLQKDHAQIRLSAVQFNDELFNRSHVFRTLRVDDFQTFLKLAVGTDTKFPLPPPAGTAKLVRKTALLAIQRWHAKFGKHYQKLALGYKFLEERCRIDFADVEARDELEQRRAREAETRKRIQRQQKYSEAKVEMVGQWNNIKANVNEMTHCFELVVPEVDGRVDEGAAREELGDINEVARRYGLGTKGYSLQVRLDGGIEIPVTSGNANILKTLVELDRLNTGKYLPMVNRWLDALVQVKDEASKVMHTSQDGADLATMMKDCIDLKQELDTAKRQFSSLQFDRTRLQRVLDGKDRDEEEEESGYGFLVHIDRGNAGREKSAKKTEMKELCDDSDDDMEEVILSDDDDYRDPPSALNPPPTNTGLLSPNKKNEANDEKRRPVSPKSPRKEKETEKKDGKKETPAHSAKKSGWTLNSYKEQLHRRGAPVVDPTVGKLAQGHTGPEHKDNLEISKNSSEEAAAVSEGASSDPGSQSEGVLDPKRADDITHKWWSSGVDHEGGSISASHFRTRVEYYQHEFNPDTAWSCRAALPSGKLCTRKDKVKCPFHGKIIARDKNGQPNGPEAEELERAEREREEAARAEAEASRAKEEAERVPLWVEVAEDMGMEVPSAFKRKKEEKKKKPEKVKKPKSNLVDLKKEQDTTRSRLRRKLDNKGALHKLAHELNVEEQARHRDLFGNQWQYY